jgi:glutamate 5-kinase
MSAKGKGRGRDDGGQELKKARRIVVKIGSKTLATRPDVYAELAAGCAEARKNGQHVVIVSSGAIALGTKKLGYKTRPKEIAKLQAAAAAGQSLLMRAYEEAFSAADLEVAQVLLTHADLSHRTRANNAREALTALLDAGAIPVLNENDSVAVDEIKFGDNDALSSMVLPLVEGDLLILLSDVPGVLDGDGARIKTVRDVAKDALPHVRATKSDVGTGGMGSKIEAARRATLFGASCVIADAREPGILSQILRADDVGTFFFPAAKTLGARRHWIAFTLRPRGDLVLDPGAVAAVQRGTNSVLAIGVLGVRGAFRAGDAVRILDGEGRELGRGLARASDVECMHHAGKRAETGEEAELVHRDDLVLLS